MTLHLFWDNSNIWLSGKDVSSMVEPGHELDFRIHFARLLSAVKAQRPLASAVVAGSLPPDNDALWETFDRLGVRVIKQERGNQTGGEVAVDEVLQLAMANTVLDHAPGTMLLLTGDGSGSTQGQGFLTQLQRARRYGWNIEVASWAASCNRFLKEYAQKEGQFIRLDDHYADVTFIAKGRPVGEKPGRAAPATP
ncbi:NYN domain-containing protein [Deinococcus seoulensis]|nr:NYN domain-containing protein [Deinococcus seoulensis]